MLDHYESQADEEAVAEDEAASEEASGRPLGDASRFYGEPIMLRIRLFISMCLLGGLGGFVGSVIGNAFGTRALFIGGFLGGVAVAPFAARIAVWRHWITPRQYWPTAAGTAVGFLAAALVAVNTLSSPVGPILSTTLTGLGALVGSRFAR